MWPFVPVLPPHPLIRVAQRAPTPHTFKGKEAQPLPILPLSVHWAAIGIAVLALCVDLLYLVVSAPASFVTVTMGRSLLNIKKKALSVRQLESKEKRPSGN